MKRVIVLAAAVACALTVAGAAQAGDRELMAQALMHRPAGTALLAHNCEWIGQFRACTAVFLSGRGRTVRMRLAWVFERPIPAVGRLLIAKLHRSYTNGFMRDNKVRVHPGARTYWADRGSALLWDATVTDLQR